MILKVGPLGGASILSMELSFQKRAQRDPYPFYLVRIYRRLRPGEKSTANQPPEMWETNFCCLQSTVKRQWHATPVLLPGKSHGQRSLGGCSPWGRQELDTTEPLHFHFSLSCTGEGNGNPLQCSCLENPGDGGAWWAAVYGVAQSRTRLKRLSSSSSMQFIEHWNSPPIIWLWVHEMKLFGWWEGNELTGCFHTMGRWQMSSEIS